MESTTEQGLPQAKSTDDTVIYRAVGWVAGRYQPSEEDVHRGIFVTQDGLSISAQMTGQLRARLKRRHPDYAIQPDFFTQSFWWTIYPKTEPLRFELRGIKPISSAPTERPNLDEFCVVGKVKSIEPDVVNVRIQRNQPPRWGGKKASFKLTLAGSLPEIALGQIWELTVRREGEKLTVVDGQIYQPSAEDLVWLEQQRQATVHSNLPAKMPAQQQRILPLPAKMPAQQQQTLPLPESHQERSPVANPMQRVKEPLKQQRPSKTSLSQSQQQRDQPASQKNKFSPAKTSVEPQPQKPVFQVKVNDRVFNGYESVTLNRRVICIDGKPIAQAKIAVVVGHPTTMQADGGVTQGSDQAVLISR